VPPALVSKLAAVESKQIGRDVRIEPFAYIHQGAVLERGCTIGAHSVVHAGCVVGEGSSIGESCVLGVRGPAEPLRIGARSLIRSHTVIYSGSVLDEGLETGHHVVIREGSNIGRNLRIGNFSDIEGGCTIGDYCRFHGYVHVGKGARIGSFVWLYSLTTLLNDPLPPSHVAAPVSIGDGAVVCVGSTLMPEARLGSGAFVAAGSVVSGEVPAGAVVAHEGTTHGHVTNLVHMPSGTRHPWMRHFASAFPEAAQPRIRALLDEILAGKFARHPGDAAR
jgi:UDP-3-O-[3-hydroxymyristoyl] glucosamine N-acyltransferase